MLPSTEGLDTSRDRRAGGFAIVGIPATQQKADELPGSPMNCENSATHFERRCNTGAEVRIAECIHLQNDGRFVEDEWDERQVGRGLQDGAPDAWAALCNL